MIFLFNYPWNLISISENESGVDDPVVQRFLERTDAKQRNQLSGSGSTGSFGQVVSTSNVVTLKPSAIPVPSPANSTRFSSCTGFGSQPSSVTPKSNTSNHASTPSAPLSQSSGSTGVAMPVGSGVSGPLCSESPVPVPPPSKPTTLVVPGPIPSGPIISGPTISGAPSCPISAPVLPAAVSVANAPPKVSLEDRSIHSVDQNVIPFVGPVEPSAGVPLVSTPVEGASEPPPVDMTNVSPQTPPRNGSPPNSLENTPSVSDAGDPMDL